MQLGALNKFVQGDYQDFFQNRYKSHIGQCTVGTQNFNKSVQIGTQNLSKSVQIRTYEH